MIFSLREYVPSANEYKNRNLESLIIKGNKRNGGLINGK